MEIYASEENLRIVQQAITELVEGKRRVKAEYTTPEGYRHNVEYTDVSLGELRQLEAEMLNTLKPTPIMESLDVEIEF